MLPLAALALALCGCTGEAPDGKQSVAPVDLPTPREFKPEIPKQQWTADDYDYDPFLVKRPEVNLGGHPGPAYYETLRHLEKTWPVDGVSHTKAGGWEVHFRGQLKPFRKGDRLPGTEFTVRRIFMSKDGVGVQLTGAAGGQFQLVLARPSRYGVQGSKVSPDLAGLVVDGISRMNHQWTVWFRGMLGSYRAGDRITGTPWTIHRIIWGRDGAGVVVYSDDGDRQLLRMGGD